ncbi:MAG: YicC/YloC family endoribonuclease [Pseudomonadota bacterium]
MTGFASVEGAADGVSWSWDIRSLNARGFDLRLRLPERAQGIETDIRKKLSAAVKRGSVQVGLRLRHDAAIGSNAPSPDLLANAVAAVEAARQALSSAGLPAGPVDPVRLLALPALSSEPEQTDLPVGAVLADFDRMLAAFLAMRAEEGAALARVIAGQIDEIEELSGQANHRAGLRGASAAERYTAQVSALVAAAGQAVDAERLSHDLAALTVKGDVTEELDRLAAHIAAARALLSGGGPLGRKFDFLTQEFNREANTLCAKSADTGLTQAGLDLKVVIDQMREQVQNVE